jgi:hypothetical protein
MSGSTTAIGGTIGQRLCGVQSVWGPLSASCQGLLVLVAVYFSRRADWATLDVPDANRRTFRALHTGEFGGRAVRCNVRRTGPYSQYMALCRGFLSRGHHRHQCRSEVAFTGHDPLHLGRSARRVRDSASVILRLLGQQRPSFLADRIVDAERRVCDFGIYSEGYEAMPPRHLPIRAERRL